MTTIQCVITEATTNSELQHWQNRLSKNKPQQYTPPQLSLEAKLKIEAAEYRGFILSTAAVYQLYVLSVCK